jgi:MoaA/NifB/PqqE/SkfB family radical SAM enzyme
MMGFERRLAQLNAAAGIIHGARSFGGPFQAALWMTSQCNVKCIHCFFHSPYVRKPNLFEVRRARLTGSELPDENYIKKALNLYADRGQTMSLIDELIKMGTQEFLFTGIGEPFLHKNILEFMGHAKKAGRRCVVNTNGTLLDRSKIDELIKMGFDELRITTMAGTREMYGRTHPGAPGETLEAIRDNLLYLAERKASLKLKTPEVFLAYVVIADNHDGLPDFARLSLDIKADKVNFRPFDDTKDPDFAALIPSNEQALSVLEDIEKVRDYLESGKISHNIDYFKKVFREQIDTSELYRIIPCYMGWLGVRINLMDGNVYACCKCYEPLGNIHEKKFREIWHGRAYNNFRIQAKKITKPVHGCDCSRCANHTPNLRTFKMLHPIEGRSLRLRKLLPGVSAGNKQN